MGPLELGAIGLLIASHAGAGALGYALAASKARADRAEEKLQELNEAIEDAEERHDRYEVAESAVDRADTGDLDVLLRDSAEEATAETRVST